MILSLEMHCSLPQQYQIAKLLKQHLGEMLLEYDDLVASGLAKELSPDDLRNRVLVKGKVKSLVKPKHAKARPASLQASLPPTPGSSTWRQKVGGAMPRQLLRVTSRQVTFGHEASPAREVSRSTKGANYAEQSSSTRPDKAAFGAVAAARAASLLRLATVATSGGVGGCAALWRSASQGSVSLSWGS